MASRAPLTLVVEPDAATRRLVERLLRAEGAEVHSADARRPIDVERAVGSLWPDVVVLGSRGAAEPRSRVLARSVRSATRAPILLLTSTEDLDWARDALDTLDDFATAPYSAPQLALRLHLLLRRAGSANGLRLRLEDLVMDVGSRQVSRRGQTIDLTRTEFDLLAALLEHRGQVLSRAQLIRLALGKMHLSPNAVEVHVSSLRRKLDAQGPRLIRTVRGVGYVIRAT